MASAIMHICVAKRINETLKFHENKLFLGAIAPDISKQLGEDKVSSHFILNDLSNNVPNLDLFLDRYRSSLIDTFDLGYFIHLYTDKLFYENFLPMFVNDNNVKTLAGKDIVVDSKYITKMLYSDFTNMNVTLIDEYNLDLSLFYEEFEQPVSAIKEIPVDKLDTLIDKMGVIIANSKDKKNIVLNYSKVIEFINNAADEILDYLFTNNLIVV